MQTTTMLSNYKGLTKEELRQLPLDDLAAIAHEALQNWDKLNQRLNQDSTNSSLSPSTDSPEAKAKRQAEQHEKASAKSHRRKHGAQPGHKATFRPLLELREGDAVVDCAPERCAHCGKSLKGLSDAEPFRHQKVDVKIHRHITEYRRHNVSCPCCGRVTAGSLPEGVRESGYGENVVALLGVLTGICHLSRRMAQMLMEKLFEVPMSLGTVSKLEEELTKASLPVMKTIEEAAQSAPRGNADETGFGMKNGKSGWLWVLVSPTSVLFRLFANRTRECAKQLLGGFTGILTTDRYGAYNSYPPEKRQICWAHLIRDFQSMIERGSDGEAIGKALKKEARAMFHLWHRFKTWKKNQESKGVRVSMTVLESQVHARRKRILSLLEEGAKRSVLKCGSILKVEPLMWTFTKTEGIEPTNNDAERAIRPAVLWKKRSFGVESERGASYVASMLSLWATCQCNGRNAVEYLREVVVAHRSKSPVTAILRTS